MSRPARLLATLGAVAALGGGVAALLIFWAGGPSGPWQPANECRATADGHTAVLGPEQARHATTIATVGMNRGLPARAVTIALATAYQESDIYNLDYGDRDSLGLFQQRPSQGWGSPAQVQDPVYAARAFYEALEQVPGYRNMEITEAAQEVQRSAYPDAYADHEDDARVLASALTGYSEAAFYCTFERDSYEAQPEGADGLTERARTVRDQLVEAFGDLDIGGYRPGGIDSGHVEGSAHYDGRALDVMFRPYDDAAVNRRGWALAQWATAHADELGIAVVIYDDRIWSARRSDEGWRAYTHPSGDTTDVTLRHLDHVHIAVAEGS
ncbi:hypothetical protein CLV30_11282 [Haloactinopolyspora alba]|uniref:ARB-07466-like C-terminal domain-containing protein n=1 Tax=Haloactinopolyspora alba TaxID=648780 RepID=A0A2P8DXA1_9ACTN|nr:hypothetical protein [Haloactinopolyspora alba]PSL01843.1 hypothetical protein CLV30_11282 [Haloactinopolyspora alba]